VLEYSGSTGVRAIPSHLPAQLEVAHLNSGQMERKDQPDERHEIQ